ncbi:MAG: hypothetical protein LBT53_05810 [Puniceicoccales bacterium]|jgi:hypothetical protein|nr:hypothetical protein [Puniceicoccales bacterium]
MPDTSQKSLGFPPQSLGAEPERLPVLYVSADALALATTPAPTPATAATAAVADATAAAPLAAALCARYAESRPEFLALPFRPPCGAVWPPETDVHSIAVFAARGEALARWRNAFGSDGFLFTYSLLAADAPECDIPDAFVCELPVARHTREVRALVSRTTGKKSRTEFRCLARAGRWSWWEARTSYPRFHQVRLHAAESGLLVVGERFYADGGEIAAAQLLPKGRLNKGVSRPLHDGVCLRLASVDCAAADPAAGLLVAPEPPKWVALRRRLALASASGLTPPPARASSDARDFLRR